MSRLGGRVPRKSASNEQTMFLFKGGSIAAFTDLGEGRYRTSIDRELVLGVMIEPPALAPLVEWRPQGMAATTELGSQ